MKKKKLIGATLNLLIIKMFWISLKRLVCGIFSGDVQGSCLDWLKFLVFGVLFKYDFLTSDECKCEKRSFTG